MNPSEQAHVSESYRARFPGSEHGSTGKHLDHKQPMRRSRADSPVGIPIKSLQDVERCVLPRLVKRLQTEHRVEALERRRNLLQDLRKHKGHSRRTRGALAAHSRDTHTHTSAGPISKLACTVVRILFQLIAKYVIV